MAASSYLQMQTMALLQQQIVSQIASGGLGFNASIADALLSPHKKTAREISAPSLTGRIRSDAGMLRQASRNVDEGEAISRISHDVTKFVEESLGKMKDLATAVANGTGPGDATTQYGNLANGIKSRIESAAYNGISLLDKNKWATDSRLTSTGPNTAKLSLQIGESARDLTLRDLSGVNDQLAATDISNQTSAQNALTDLSSIISNVSLQSNGYKRQAEGFASESKSLERQADILSTTAKRAEASPHKSPRDILMDLLMSEQGGIFDDKL